MTIENYLKLVDKINHHNYLYHVLDKPEISDYEYDTLLKTLEQMEADHPDWRVSYSPTVRVGGVPISAFKEVTHKVKLLSLANTYSKEELHDFENRIKKEWSKPFHYALEYKIDGLSVAITYKNGISEKAATRGNGSVGEDITENVMTIASVPLKLNEPVDITVRGEVFIAKKGFEAMNKQQERLGKATFANPRNAAAGSLRQLDSKIAAKRPLDIFVFSILDGVPTDVTTQSGALQYLQTLGFKVSKSKVFSSIDEAMHYIEETEKNRHELYFDIDGMVVNIDEIALQKKLGARTRTPKWAVAYKFKAEQAITKLVAIHPQVGRTGAITPRAEFEPVFVAGSTVQYATLHNQDFIDEKDIRIGDTVVIEKAGDVIPAVVEVKKELRNGSEVPYHLPEFCPICQTKTLRVADEVALKCPNPKCPAKDKRAMTHFVSKVGMDIEGLGEAVVEQLIDEAMISDYADIYNLSEMKPLLLKLERMGEKKVDNLLLAIEASKQNSLEKLLSALGIEHTGEKAALVLAKHFKSLNNLMEATPEALQAIDGIGQKMAESIMDYFNNPVRQEMLTRLVEAGVNTEYVADDLAVDELVFADEIVVLTGALNVLSRSEASKYIAQLGGKTSGSVSKKTTLLIAGEGGGSKLTKAQSLGTPIIDEDAFIERLKRAGIEL